MPQTFANLTTYLTSTGSFRASKSYMILRLKCVGLPDFAHGFALDSRPVTLNCVFSGQLWFKSHGNMVTSKGLTNVWKKKCLGERNGRWFVSICINILKNLSGSLKNPVVFWRQLELLSGQAYYACKQNAGISLLAGLTAGITQEARNGKFLLRLTVKMAWSMGVQKA